MLSLTEIDSKQSEHQIIADILKKLLLDPSEGMRSRPSNKFRSRLVELGICLGGNHKVSKENLKTACLAIESLHLGSLIIDDIQDGSDVRRGFPALHKTHGVPHALSVGNWLYFNALTTLDKLNVDNSTLLTIHKEWHSAMEWAHYGQVMDLSCKIPTLPVEEIASVCHFTALYKTGCITGLAVAMGAILSGADSRHVLAIKELGCALGIYLQNLNDVGNIIGQFDEEKRFEDLILGKPSYVWALTLETYGEGAYQELLSSAASLPDTSQLLAWLRQYPLDKLAPEQAGLALGRALAHFDKNYPDTDLGPMLALKERIQKAYA